MLDVINLTDEQVEFIFKEFRNNVKDEPIETHHYALLEKFRLVINHVLEMYVGCKIIADYELLEPQNAIHMKVYDSKEEQVFFDGIANVNGNELIWTECNGRLKEAFKENESFLYLFAAINDFIERYSETNIFNVEQKIAKKKSK